MAPAHGMPPFAAGVATDERSAEQGLATAFGNHVARWAREQRAPAAAVEMARRAATLVSLATSNGHSCLALDELADSLDDHADTARDGAAVSTLLLESKTVGSADAPDSLPLILDDERLYLHRYFDYECRLAAALAARGADSAGAAAPGTYTQAGQFLSSDVVALLDRLFAANAVEPGAPDWQKIAVITALLGRLTIITGGPGTGKTTTVVNLLACLLQADPACRIVLTAPTGKAAARMTEVVQQRAGHLPDALRTKLPTQSSTIHRLLGSLPNGEFRHHSANVLPIDVLVVDEASMLDLALAVHLIEAVPAGARIILLGDKDQLAAVESGAVFSELSGQPTLSPQRIQVLSALTGISPQTLRAAGPSQTQPQRDAPPPPPPDASPKARQLELPLTIGTPPPDPMPPERAVRDAMPDRATRLEDCVIWLRRNYRFVAGSSIGPLAADINEGHAAQALERLGRSTDGSLAWVNDGARVPSPPAMRAILDGYGAYIDSVRNHAADARSVTAAFARFRVLCAVRDGPRGVNALNRDIAAHFRRELRHPFDPGLRSDWYPGRPVMVLRNDPVLKLFNGDIGIVLPDADGALQVHFPDDTGGFRSIASVRLPEHETAFAMTVHKSQGSEFDEITLVLPAEHNRILTRELLYTAVTRARERLGLIATATVIASAIDTATKRVSGLLARVRRVGS